MHIKAEPNYTWMLQQNKDQKKQFTDTSHFSLPNLYGKVKKQQKTDYLFGLYIQL